MSLFNNLYQPQQQLEQPQFGSTPQQQPTQTPQTGQPNLSGMAPPPDLGKLLGMLIQATHGRHLGADGQEMSSKNDPFGGPLQFKSAEERKSEMDNHTGAYAPHDPMAMAQTNNQMFNAGVTPHHQVGQVIGQQQDLNMGSPLPQANPQELSGYEQQHHIPGGSLPLGSLISPYGVGFSTQAQAPRKPASTVLPAQIFSRSNYV